MLSLYTVCFFGHRRIDDIISVENAVENVIDKVLRQHEYVEFLVGRDGEFDRIVSSAVLRYKKRTDAGNCSLTWVMPYMKSDYTHNRENYDSYYDSVEVCEQSAMAHPKSAIKTFQVNCNIRPFHADTSFRRLFSIHPYPASVFSFDYRPFWI